MEYRNIGVLGFPILRHSLTPPLRVASERLDLDVAEGNRGVVPGEAEVAFGAVLGGMLAVRHEFRDGGQVAVKTVS